MRSLLDEYCRRHGEDPARVRAELRRKAERRLRREFPSERDDSGVRAIAVDMTALAKEVADIVAETVADVVPRLVRYELGQLTGGRNGQTSRQ